MSSQTLAETIDLVDISSFLEKPTASDDCNKIAQSLKETGAVLIRDARVTEEHSSMFLNLMERYFAQPSEMKIPDARPELSHQVGVTPSHTERPRDNSAVVATYTLENKPLTADSAGKSDPKWRFFWRIGPRPLSTDFPELNAPPVIPAAFRDEWAETLNPWGTRLLDAVMTVAEMLALGLGLPQNAISDKLQYGPHLLAPTGSDMSLLSQRVGTTIAGFHYDINALTIHGKSRYPGLFVWTRSGMRIPVHVPDGCLLVQAGIQIEHLTSGLIKRGMHEVVVSEETRSAAQAALREGRCTWRVSSTLFAHVRSDEPLDPLGQFGEPRGLRAGDQIAAELRALNLAK